MSENKVPPEFELHVKDALEAFLPQIRDVVNQANRTIVHEMRNELQSALLGITNSVHDLDLRMTEVETESRTTAKVTKFYVTIAVAILGAVAGVIAAFK